MGARRGALPTKFAPQLATLVEAPPANPEDWVFEVKFDGYRMLARIDAKAVRLFTRNGHDWSARLPHLVQALAKRKLPPCWLDGEIVVPGPKGATSFQLLQNAFDSERTGDVVYYLFDLPFCDGEDLRQVPLVDRRARLQKLIGRRAGPVKFSETFDAAPEHLVESACRLGLEGIIGKRRDGPYRSKRSPDWIKLKCTRRQEFVIGGWTDPRGSREAFGALLLGVRGVDGELAYAGKVGTGFDAAKLASLHSKLQALATKRKPFHGKVENERLAHWVQPKLVAEVTFTEWTQDGHIRHGVFHALRTDKPARAIVREAPASIAAAPPPAPARGRARPKAAAASAPPDLPADLRVTHPERVIDRSTGLTKLDVVHHYARVGALMMEHLKGRPVSLVRAPQGIAGELFFQKHLDKAKMEGVARLDPALDRDHVALLEIARPLGLLTAAQFNVIEFHTWNAIKTAIDTPDRMTFDLDPGEGVKWPRVQEAARLMHAFLQQLGLVAFLKTSGGKGLHVVTPIRRELGWDEVKGFSQRVVQHMAATLPGVFVAKSGPRNRVGRIFIDYLRNGFGATTASAWSARARPGLGVSVPLAWDELDAITGGAHFHLRNLEARLATGNVPWNAWRTSAKSLKPAIRRLDDAP